VNRPGVDRLTQESEKRMRPAPEPLTSGLDPIVRYPTSVLFVDDEAASISSLRDLFEGDGYQLWFSASGHEALAVLGEHPVDIIFSDMWMPQMNGVEFLKLAAERAPETTRIILSGYEDKTIVLDTLAKGYAQHYLLKPWDEVELRTVVARAAALQKRLRDQKLEKVLAAFTDLPSPPRFHVRLHTLLNSFDKSLDELVSGIEETPTLIAKLLHVANSIYCGIRQPVNTVKEAIIFIGTEYVRTLVLALEVFQNFHCKMDPYAQRRLEYLWGRALSRASIAKRISAAWKGSGDPHLAYATSLLQDVGHLVRLCTDPESFERMIELKEADKSTLYAAEVKTFRVLHDEVGAALLTRWNFPQEIVHSVAYHHRESGGDPLIQTIQIAEVLDSNGVPEPHDLAIDPLVQEWCQRLEMRVRTRRQSSSG